MKKYEKVLVLVGKAFEKLPQDKMLAAAKLALRITINMTVWAYGLANRRLRELSVDPDAKGTYREHVTLDARMSEARRLNHALMNVMEQVDPVQYHKMHHI